MRIFFVICQMFEFWREILEYYTYTPRVYSYTYRPRIFPPKHRPFQVDGKEIVSNRSKQANPKAGEKTDKKRSEFGNII